MKPFLFILLSFSFCYSWGQEFIKDTLLIEFEGKTVQYIIGKTTAIEVQADFPELKLTLKDNRHASRNFQYKIRLGSIKNGLQFDFYHKAEFKEDILLSESTLSRVSTRPRKGLTINDLNCDIKNKNALKNIPFKTDTFFQSFRNNRKYESLTSDSENFTILFKGKKKKVTKISFNESFETQVFNQDVYEEWKSLKDSTEMCQNILQLAFNIPEMDEFWSKNEKSLVIQDENLFPKTVKVSKFNSSVLIHSRQELKQKNLSQNTVVQGFSFYDYIDEFGNVTIRNCRISYIYLPTKTRADVILKWNGLEWEVEKTEVFSESSN